jgi:hypothetical protein
MAVNLAFTTPQTDIRGGNARTAAIEGSGAPNRLDTANDNTVPFGALGYKDHEVCFNVASIGTNIVANFQKRLSPNGAWITVATVTPTANGAQRLTHSGLAESTRLVLASISGGTPQIDTIAFASSNPY